MKNHLDFISSSKFRSTTTHTQKVCLVCKHLATLSISLTLCQTHTHVFKSFVCKTQFLPLFGLQNISALPFQQTTSASKIVFYDLSSRCVNRLILDKLRISLVVIASDDERFNVVRFDR